MAIAYDAYSGVSATTGTSLTFSHTCTGSDRILFVMGHDQSGASSLVTGVTYNGVAMTQIGSGVRVPGDRYLTMWYLIAPATGANNVVVSASGSTGLRFSAISYTGAKQSGQPDANTTNTGSSVSSITTTVTTVANNCWMLMFSKDSDGTGTYTTSTGGQMRLASDAGGHAVVDSNAALTPAGSKSQTISRSGSVNIGAIGASFAPVAGTAYSQTLAETLTDTDTKAAATTRTLTETVTDTDTLPRSTSRTLTESVTDTDSLVSLKIVPLNCTENQTQSDSLVRDTTKVLSETLTDTDTLPRTTSRTLSETLTDSDTIAFQSVLARTLTEIQTLIDTLTSAYPIHTVWAQESVNGSSWSQESVQASSWTLETTPT